MNPIQKSFECAVLRTTIAAGLAILFSSLASDVQSAELIHNGSFEHLGLPSDAGWNDGVGIGNDRGLGQFQYPFIVDGRVEGGNAAELPPGADDPGFTGFVKPQGADDLFGLRWGFGNGSGSQGSATQHLDLTRYAGTSYQFSAWLASRPGDPDYAIVSLELFDEVEQNGSLLDSVLFNGDDLLTPFIVGSLNLEGIADPAIAATQDNWKLYRTTGIIPATAQSAAITIRSALDIYGYVDLVSLQVVPEPNSALLITTCVPLLIVWRRASAGRAGRSLFPRA